MIIHNKNKILDLDYLNTIKTHKFNLNNLLQEELNKKINKKNKGAT